MFALVEGKGGRKGASVGLFGQGGGEGGGELVVIMESGVELGRFRPWLAKGGIELADAAEEEAQGG